LLKCCAANVPCSRAAIAHQLARPALARALEYAEATPPLRPETDNFNHTIGQHVARVLTAMHIPDPRLAAADLTALVRGMVDAAGLRGETDCAALFARIWAAVAGYLRSTPPGHTAPTLP
jgi:hypothetical protein